MHPDLFLDEDDICFCSNSKCGWKKRCFRHPSGIKHSYWVYSFSDFSGGPICPKWRREHDGTDKSERTRRTCARSVGKL